MSAINENLKMLRQEKEMTQADVAHAISVTRQTISSYESGRTQPDLETLKRLAEVYQADLLDVLYGGNRFQQLIKKIKFCTCGLAAIMLLGLLIHSALLWIANSFFPMESGTIITESNRALVEMRFALRDAAELASAIGTSIFVLGCVLMLYPSGLVLKAISLRKLLLSYSVTIAAMFICIFPFAITDKIYGAVDYFFPMWKALIYLTCFFAVMSVMKVIKYRISNKRCSDYKKR